MRPNPTSTQIIMPAVCILQSERTQKFYIGSEVDAVFPFHLHPAPAWTVIPVRGRKCHQRRILAAPYIPHACPLHQDSRKIVFSHEALQFTPIKFARSQSKSISPRQAFQAPVTFLNGQAVAICPGKTTLHHESSYG